MASLLELLFNEIEKTGWKNFSLAAFEATHEELKEEIAFSFPTKVSILLRYLDVLDLKTLSYIKTMEGESSFKDHLFDIMMHRFDEMQAHRQVLKVIINHLWLDPCDSLECLKRMQLSCEKIIKSFSGGRHEMQNFLYSKGLLLIYLNACRIWIYDETSDLSQTMVALDQGLSKGEELKSFLY